MDELRSQVAGIAEASSTLLRKPYNGSRFFLRRLNDAVAKLLKQNHRTGVSVEMRKDIDWWCMYHEQFNVEIEMINSRPITPLPTHVQGRTVRITSMNMYTFTGGGGGD